MECVLWEGAVYGVEPVLSFGVDVVDDAVQAVCGHDITEQAELEVGCVEESSGSIQSSGVDLDPIPVVLLPGHRLTPVALAAARSRVRMGVSRSTSPDSWSRIGWHRRCALSMISSTSRQARSTRAVAWWSKVMMCSPSLIASVIAWGAWTPCQASAVCQVVFFTSQVGLIMVIHPFFLVWQWCVVFLAWPVKAISSLLLFTIRRITVGVEGIVNDFSGGVVSV